MIKQWYFKNVRWQRHDLKYWDLAGKENKKKRKVLVTGFRHMRGTLFAIGAFLRHTQRKTFSHPCHLPVCQQSCFLLTQGNEPVFTI